MTLLDKIVWFVSVAYPLAGVPQVIKIWYYQDVTGVSFWTWLLFLVFSIPLIIYSLDKKDYKMVFMWSSWVVIYVSVLSGLLLYS